MIDYGDPRAMERLLSDRDWRRAVAPSVVDAEDVERAARSGDLPGAPESVDHGRAMPTGVAAVTTYASRDNRRDRRWSGSAAEELARVVEERRS